MFDSVPRARYEQERDRRVLAEAREQAALATIATLNRTIDSLNQLLREQAQLHHTAFIDVMDRYEPKPSDPRTFPSDEILKSMTSEQIMAEPAYSRQQMFRRARLATEARTREQLAEREKRNIPADVRSAVAEVLSQEESAPS